MADQQQLRIGQETWPAELQQQFLSLLSVSLEVHTPSIPGHLLQMELQTIKLATTKAQAALLLLPTRLHFQSHSTITQKKQVGPLWMEQQRLLLVERMPVKLMDQL